MALSSLIDTHAHLNMCVKESETTPFSAQDMDRVRIIVAESVAANVTRIVTIGTTLLESTEGIQIAQEIPEVYATVGIHPNDIGQTWQHDLHAFRDFVQSAREHKIVGIGECGLDYHYPNFDKELQKKVFIKQIELALEYDLALVVHTRSAGFDTMEVLQNFKRDPLRATIHCFSEDQKFADAAVEQKLFLGIGGTVTYPKNNQLREIVQRVGLEHIVLETDAPFLPPQTMRGKKNHPREIATIAQYVAELLHNSAEAVALTTTTNARSLFMEIK